MRKKTILERPRGFKELIWANRNHRFVADTSNNVYYVSVKFTENDIIDMMVNNGGVLCVSSWDFESNCKAYLKEKGIDIDALKQQKNAEKETNSVTDGGEDYERLPF